MEGRGGRVNCTGRWPITRVLFSVLFEPGDEFESDKHCYHKSVRNGDPNMLKSQVLHTV